MLHKAFLLQDQISANKTVASHNKNASRCCARVAAADWLTCRLVVERLTPGEDGVVVECVH